MTKVSIGDIVADIFIEVTRRTRGQWTLAFCLMTGLGKVIETLCKSSIRIWDKCAEWPQNNTDKIKGTGICYCICPQVPNFTPFRCTIRQFRATGHLWDKCTNHPKNWQIEQCWTYMYVLLVLPPLKCHSVSLYNQPFLTYGTFATSTLWPRVSSLWRHRFANGVNVIKI